jgi:hypothetical protein
LFIIVTFHFQFIYSSEYAQNGGNGGRDGDAHGHDNVHHDDDHDGDGGDEGLRQEELLGKLLHQEVHLGKPQLQLLFS